MSADINPSWLPRFCIVAAHELISVSRGLMDSDILGAAIPIDPPRKIIPRDHIIIPLLCWYQARAIGVLNPGFALGFPSFCLRRPNPKSLFSSSLIETTIGTNDNRTNKISGQK